MPTIFNNAEGLTNGITPTTANTGGVSGDACTTVTHGLASTIVASSSAALAGSMGYLFNLAGDANDGACRLMWSFTESGRAVVSAYFRISTLPTTGLQSIMGVRNGSGNMGYLLIGTDGKLAVNNASGAGISVSRAPDALSPNVVYRIEFAVEKGTNTSDGTLGYAYFIGDSTSPVHEWESSSQNAGTANVASVFVGRATGCTDAAVAHYDSIRASSLALGWHAPLVTPSTTLLRRNDFDFAPAGTVITAANSGDVTNYAFDLVNGAPTIISSGALSTGANVTGDSSTQALFTWNSLALMSFSSRYYFKLGAAPSTLAQLHTLRNGSTTITGNNLTTGSKITVVRNGGATVYTSTTTLSSSQWYRVALWGRVATASTGELHFRLYAGDSTTVLESYDSTSVDLGTVSITNTLLGKHSASTVYSGGLSVDDWGLADEVAEIAPYVAPSNTPPVINLSADKVIIYPGESAMITASITDDHDQPGDMVIDWSVTGGTLSGTGTSRTLTAPASLNDQTATITVTATDTQGSESAQAIQIVQKASAYKFFDGVNWVPLIRRLM